MPYLTPQYLPSARTCRRLLIPSSGEWLAIFSGALTELLKNHNWQEAGITVDDAIDAVRDIIDSYYDDPCDAGGDCITPEGTRILRMLADGYWQELQDGVWQEPTGDYTIEQPPPRGESTPEDRLCLASANAANVFKELYEQVTDAFDASLTIEPVITALLEGIAALMAIFVSVASAGFLSLGILALGIFFDGLSTITFDLWNEAFEQLLICIFQENASDEDGIVRFNFGGINAALEAEIANFNTTLNHKLLCGQVLYLLSITGKSGIEWAATTTAITSADCDCETGWTCRFVFNMELRGWQMLRGDLLPNGVIMKAISGDATPACIIERDFSIPAASTVTEIRMHYAGGYGNYDSLSGGINVNGDNVLVVDCPCFGIGEWAVSGAWDGDLTIYAVLETNQLPVIGGIEWMQLSGIGENPIFDCEP